MIEGAQWLVETFCKCDPSAVGTDSFDSWIANAQEDAGRLYCLVDEDITAVNRTMAARTSHKAWAPIIAKGDVTWLRNLDPEWDLFEMSDEAWSAAGVSSVLRKAFEATVRPKLKLAVITKVLHIKRPRLIPVMDSVVMLQIGAPVSDDIDTWVHAVEEVRRIGRRTWRSSGPFNPTWTRAAIRAEAWCGSSTRSSGCRARAPACSGTSRTGSASCVLARVAW